MTSLPWYWRLQRMVGWVLFLPAWLGFRLIWLTAKLGNREAKDVHLAMWDAGLAIPPLTAEQKADPYLSCDPLGGL